MRRLLSRCSILTVQFIANKLHCFFTQGANKFQSATIPKLLPLTGTTKFHRFPCRFMIFGCNSLAALYIRWFLHRNKQVWTFLHALYSSNCVPWLESSRFIVSRPLQGLRNFPQIRKCFALIAPTDKTPLIGLANYTRNSQKTSGDGLPVSVAKVLLQSSTRTSKPFINWAAGKFLLESRADSKDGSE